MNILFVCTGNTCRSPMAEGILKSMIKSGDNIHILSAGIFAYEGESASKEAIEAMKRMGIDISAHVSHPISERLIDEADLILTMTKQHMDMLLRMHLSARGKTHTILGYTGKSGDIADPYGGNAEVYDVCAKELYSAVEAIYKKLRREKDEA